MLKTGFAEIIYELGKGDNPADEEAVHHQFIDVAYENNKLISEDHKNFLHNLTAGWFSDKEDRGDLYD
jgi:hypothetical protein